uniref:DUF1995 domain-containing protein n=1 Tax=Paulinella chromatophora TaxID=39717 RepID=B1X3T3_PAUCH|nr:hypothetical protein PCC_0151 [Paulinella chromatophora]ACB42602.1 hypothetical protein PCC_0151 [Paulinella chromatophora]
MILPIDLRTAEEECFCTIKRVIDAKTKSHWTIDFDLEGIKIMPVALRLFRRLKYDENNLQQSTILLFSDAGSTALAQREAPDFHNEIFSFKDYLKYQQQDPNPNEILLIVSPEQSDYDLFEEICNRHRGCILLLNGKLEDIAVGIGSVARKRRRSFLSNWQPVYVLLVLRGAVLQRRFPNDWELYRQNDYGYSFLVSSQGKPDLEMLDKALNDGRVVSLDTSLQALDKYIKSFDL